MKRREFLAVSGAAASLPLLGATRTTPALRVLLGKGNAHPIAGDGFEFDGRAYRGTFERASDGSIVNVVGLEEYLYGVVPREMPSSWPAQALQIQAICARTYVLRRIDPQRAYDVVPSDLAEVYDGMSAESPAGRAAVDATSGMILRYGTEFAQVAFSSCCGGHTESASDAWGGTPISYLGSVRCPYCTQSPEYGWARDIALSDVDRVFSVQRDEIGSVRDVRAPSLDESGRVREFELIAENGTLVVRGADFRIVLGPKLLPSLLITKLAVQPPEGMLRSPILHVEGRGNGHGVGLCQWGTRGIALVNGTLAATTNFYFPGTAIDTWTSISSQPTITSFLQR